jgi:hypothetical protein
MLAVVAAMRREMSWQHTLDSTVIQGLAAVVAAATQAHVGEVEGLEVESVCDGGFPEIEKPCIVSGIKTFSGWQGSGHRKERKQRDAK